MHKLRVENISDGIFAIILTLMVIEMRPPKGDLTGIVEFIRGVGIYALSYSMLIILWIHHHYLFSIMKQINTKIIWYNFLLLFFLTLIPLPTKTLGENFLLPSSHLFYGAVICANMIAFFLLENQVYRFILTGSKMHETINFKTIFVILLYAVSTALSLISIYISAAIFLISPFLYIILTRPDREIL